MPSYPQIQAAASEYEMAEEEYYQLQLEQWSRFYSRCVQYQEVGMGGSEGEGEGEGEREGEGRNITNCSWNSGLASTLAASNTRR